MADDDVYETVGIDQMTFNEADQAYEYDCICGDKFRAPIAELKAQHENDKFKGYYISECPTCGLRLKVLLDDSAWSKIQ